MHSDDEFGTVMSMPSERLTGGVLNRPPAPFSERYWLAIGVLAAFAGVAMLAVALTPHPRQGGARLMLALVACGPMLLLRRWPLPLLGATVAASGFVMASGAAPLPVAVLLSLATFFVASQLPRRVSIPVTAAAAAAIGAALLSASLTVVDAQLMLLAIEGFLPLVAAWFVGDAVAAQRRYQAGLAEQAERELAAEEDRAERAVREERVHIAQELHDVVAHSLAVITVQAGVARRFMEKRPEEASSALESIETIGRTAQEELRVVLGLLREGGNATAELSPAPRLADVEELVQTVQASGTEVELQTSGMDRQLSPALELSLYRVIQEALTNVVKHAPGARARVDVRVSAGKVRVEVLDRGDAATEAEQQGPGHGIVGMRERIGAFGGSLDAGPCPGGGFRVVAEVPIEAAS